MLESRYWTFVYQSLLHLCNFAIVRAKAAIYDIKNIWVWQYSNKSLQKQVEPEFGPQSTVGQSLNENVDRPWNSVKQGSDIITFMLEENHSDRGVHDVWVMWEYRRVESGDSNSILSSH